MILVLKLLKKKREEKMKRKLIIFGTTLVLITVAFCGCIQEESSKYSTYKNNAMGIQINYPSDWSRQEGTLVIVFLSPRESVSDLFQENLNIVKQDLSAQPMTLDEYIDIIIENLTQFLVDFNLISSSQTTLDGYSAQELHYTGTLEGRTLKWKLVVTIKDNNSYELTYSAAVDKFSDYLGTIEKMINSFEFI